MKPIVVVGSINQDMVFNTPGFPRPGETIQAQSFALYPGGKGANQAVAAARMGAPVAMVGCVGRDAFGSALVQGMIKEGIDCSYIQRTDQATGCAGIIVRADGENSIIIYPGANHAIRPQDLDPARELIISAQVLLLQLEIPLPAVIKAAQIAREAGVTIILDPAPAAKLPRELLELADVLTPNAVEAQILTDIPISCPQTAAAAASTLRGMGSRTVLITLGSMGVLVSGPGGTEQVLPPAVEVVDTTAAGDGFNGALAVALAWGCCLSDAVRLAAAAGALTVTKPGARPSLPLREDLERVVQVPW